MNYLKFTKDKLNVEEITNLASSPSCGAISVFIGTTRNNFEGKEVLKLEYEAYESMGLKSLEKICQELREKWDNIENIAIYHRLGTVPIQEASIVIAVSSPHRSDAISATEWCINNVKKSVTIWKKEIYKESGAEWKENKECAWSTLQSHPKYKKIEINFEPKVEIPPIPPHFIQVRAPNSDINKRIESFMNRKRDDINSSNVREFCKSDRDLEFSCARIDAVLQKSKNSKGHLQVSRVLNTYHRDQFNSDYLFKYIPQNGVEERIKNLEMQLSLTTATPRDIYLRLKNLENRMLYLETVSPEYIKLWDKVNLPNNIVKRKKKIFSMEEIDRLIAEAKSRVSEEKSVYSAKVT